MANSVSHAALPYPIKNARFTVAIPYLDADGDPTDPTTPDTETSGDNATFADCAEEVTTTAGANGMGFITLTGAETNFSMVLLAAKVASGPKNTLATVYPRVLAIVGSGTLSAGSAGGGTLGTLLSYDVTGCFIRTTGGTGGGGTGGASNQARKIITYNTGTGALTVAPNWETTPDNTTTYDVLLPEGVTLGMLKTLNPATAGNKLVVDANGLGDANMVKAGPTGSGTAQTAGDIIGDTNDLQARLPAALTGNGNLKVSLQEILTTALTEASGGQLAAAFKKWFDVTSPTGSVNSLPNAVAGASGGVAIVGSNMGTVASVTGNVGGSTASIGPNGLDAAALATDAVTEIVAAVFARAFSAAYASLTFDQIVKVLLAVLVGKVSGLDVGAPVFRNPADSADVVAATTDVNGNRSAVTITP